MIEQLLQIGSVGEVVYIGESTSAELITGDDLANLVGLTAGISINSDAGFIHVTDKGTHLYIAKKAFRYNLGGESLASLKLIHGETVVTINGSQYKVRCLAKNTIYPYPNNVEYDPVSMYGSEWNRIMYRLVDTPSGFSGEGIRYGEIAQYSLDDIGIGLSHLGSHACIGFAASTTLFRGYDQVNGMSFGSLIGNPYARGWRPVLELVE